MARDDEEILKELRERYDYADAEWQDIRREGAIDMRYMAGDCFAIDADARAARTTAKRPIVDADELSQYVNQLLGKARQNKRGIAVSKKGNGATDATARFRQGKVRDIEYASNAGQAYAVLLENMAQRSYGFLRVTSEYATEDGFDQELRIGAVPDPDRVTPDPNDLKSDGSGLAYLFFEEERTISEFKREFGADAKITDFSSSELFAGAKSWRLSDDKIRLAEYWTKESGPKKTKLLLKPGAPTRDNPRPQPYEVWLDDLAHKPASDLILKSRVIVTSTVVMYLTNGIEILETNSWPGESIPFVCGYGKILYVEGKRKLLSLIRLARSPQTLYAYYRTQQAEMAGMIPKVPVMGYKGQFAGVEHDWQRSPHEPLAFIEANAKTEDTGDQILPLPTRLAYEAGAHLQALELCAEGARRAIQAAIGASFLPTTAQRHNEKSGVALKQIEDTQDTGSFHFLDHYNDAIMRTGALLDELIPHFYDTARDTSIRDEEDKVKIVRINDPQAQQDGKPAYIQADEGDHDVTISVGPALASEREASSMFADMILQNQLIMQMLGPKGMKLAAMAVKLKGVGPIGDTIADLLDPPPQQGADPAQAAQQTQQLQGQMQELQQRLQQAAQIIQTKQVETEGRTKIALAQIESKERIAAMDRETKLAVAELGAKVDRMALFLEERARVGAQALDVQQAQEDRAHEVGLTVLEHDHAVRQGQQQMGQQAALADQGHQQALEAEEQAAALAPPPEMPTDPAIGAEAP